jgi:hypothetical protein
LGPSELDEFHRLRIAAVLVDPILRAILRKAVEPDDRNRFAIEVRAGFRVEIVAREEQARGRRRRLDAAGRDQRERNAFVVREDQRYRLGAAHVDRAAGDGQRDGFTVGHGLDVDGEAGILEIVLIDGIKHQGRRIERRCGEAHRVVGAHGSHRQRAHGSRRADKTECRTSIHGAAFRL